LAETSVVKSRPSVPYGANLLLIMLVQCFGICLLAAGRQMQRQTDEWRHALEQRETELTTSQTSLQVCYARVIAFR